MNNCRSILSTASTLGLLLALLLAGPAVAHGPVTFEDIGGDLGLVFTHEPSTRAQTYLDSLESDNAIDVPTEYVPAPFKPFGVPGVAIFDYDNDGDLDIYATNGPGAANSLFSNQLHESGHLGFVDVATAAGVALTDVDSQGVCYGDIDNDRDKDLLVLGFNGAHHLFENEGNGTFTDISASSHIGGQTLNGVSCGMGDVNNDGLLDIVIANAFDFTTMLVITVEPTVHNQPNQLFLNQGGNVFTDASVSSGIRNKTVATEFPNDTTWGVALVDYDEDGDVDVFFGNDMRANAFTDTFVHLYKNDGTGHFTDVTGAAHLDTFGSWRGLAFGDINCDGRIDLFATNLGDYIFFPGNIPAGTVSSAWFLQQADGTFARQTPGALVTVPNGWGTSMFDYDNDADLDIVLYGNQDNNLFSDNSNPGIILNNTGGCSAHFTWDEEALGTSRHTRRIVEGLATGDLNDDGFDDIVSISSYNVPESTPLGPIFSNPLDSVFDVSAFAVYITFPTADPNTFAYQGSEFVNGTLAVEINSADNGHNWAKVKLVGTVDITTHGESNRDGAGAVVSYTRPPLTPTSSVTRPVLGGGSMLSQNSQELVFGLDHGRRGLVEVLWPGGTKNRLYGLRLFERVTFPEIPCSYDADWENTGEYVTCVVEALDEIRDAGLLDNQGHVRFFLSALHAYFDQHGIPFS